MATKTLLPPRVRNRQHGSGRAGRERTVWTPEGLAKQANDTPQRGNGEYAFQRIHNARLPDIGNFDRVTGFEAVATGVRAQFGEKAEQERKPIVYQFDAAVFDPDQAKAWLAEQGIQSYTFEPSIAEQPESNGGAILIGEANAQQQPTNSTAEAARPVGSGRNDVSGDVVREEIGLDLHCRSITLQPESWNGQRLSVDAAIASDSPVFSHDLKSNKAVHEVWLMSGLEFDPHVPLIDNHDRSTVRKVLGSVIDHRIGEHQASSSLVISSAEPEVATKVREGHIKEVSAGGVPRETIVIPPGQSREIEGRFFTARNDQPLYVHTRFRIREVSLTTKGADPSTSIRTIPLNERTSAMKTRMRKFLERLGMSREADDTKAEEFFKKLPEETQGKCRAYADEEDNDDDDDDDDDDDEDGEEGKSKARDRKRSAAEIERVRKESEEAGRKAELDRQKELRKLGAGLPEEVVRKAIDDGMTVTAAAPHFLEQVRNRGQNALVDSFFIQSRDHGRDCTGEVLGAALSIRSLSQLKSGEAGYSQASNPVNLFGGYEPVGGVIRSDTDWTYRANRNQETRKKQVEVLLERADRYSNMSIMDMCRECCRMDGANLTSWAPTEVVRAAVSGGSFGAIFTTSFNALFLAGYLDATDTTLGWTTESDMPNFLPGERATIGKMGQLTLDGTGKPAEHMTYGDWNEPIRLHRFTGQYVVDEKDLINDRFGALQTWSPQELGLTARQMRPNLVYSTLLNNPTLNQDNVALFNAAHNNLLDSNTTAGVADLYNYRKGDGTLLNTGDPAGAVYVEPMQRAISLISEQRISGRPLNLRPRFMIMAPKLRWGAAVLFNSAERVIASSSGGTFNPLRDLGIEPRDDARMNSTGCWDSLANNGKGTLVAGKDYHWILAARPGEEGAKTMEVVYLQGTGRAPQIRSFVLGGPGAPGRWGIGWDVKHDIGVAPIDFRGFFYGKTVL